MLFSPRQCWRVGSAFYNLNKCRIHGNSRMERCYSDSKSAKMWMILLRRAEKCTLRGMSMGSRSLHPSRLQDVRWNSGCRPQVTSGIWRGIGCVHIHTHPLQQWEHQRRVCNTPQEPQEQPKPGYQKITEMLGETKPNRGMLVPSMGILSKAILKSLGDLLPWKFGQRTNLVASLMHWLGVTITAQHSTTACNPSN